MKNVEKYLNRFCPAPLTAPHWVQKQKIEKAPVWCSVDLRDGNQALAVPMDQAEKLEESGLYPDSVGTVYMAFPSGSSRIGMSVELLHYLMGDEPAAETEKVEAETAEGTTESRN